MKTSIDRVCSQNVLEETRSRYHQRCAVCGGHYGTLPMLDFKVQPDGCVEAEFEGNALYQGYEGLLHGGSMVTMLDAAMTNCLFAHGYHGVTAMLNVRFRHPVDCHSTLCVRAWLERNADPVFALRAQIFKDPRVYVEATGKFMMKPALHAL